MRPRLITFVLFGFLVGAVAPSFAQLKILSSGTTDFSMAVGDAAYDPRHDAYLLVHTICEQPGAPVGNCPVGRFMSADGATKYGSAPFDIGTFVPAYGGAGSAAYSPDLSDGAGGTGAFLVTWTAREADTTQHTGTYRLFAQVVAFPGQLVGPPMTLVQWRTGTMEGLGQPAIAYSRTDHVFLVVSNVVYSYGYSGGGIYTDVQPYYLRLDAAGQPIGAFTSVNQAHDSPCLRPHVCGGLNVQWNPASNEFGVLYDDASLVFIRIRTDGSIASKISLGAGRRSHGLGVSPRTSTYLAAYADPSGTIALELDKTGAVLGQRTVLASGVSIDDASPTMVSYSPATHSYLVDLRGVVVDVDEHGVALSQPLSVEPPFYTSPVASRGIAPEWLVTRPSGFVRVAIPSPQPYVRGDITGNGAADLIWQRPDSGGVEALAIDGGAIVGTASLNAGGTLWRVVASADFTGDGKTDLLWQHPDTGALLLWEMDGIAYVRGTMLTSGGTLWRVVAAADLTGDGKTDIVWQMPGSGAVLLWIMDGATYVAGVILNAGGTLWQVAGVADFTGDGQTDIVWQDPSTGAVLLWEMTGITYVRSTMMSGGGTLWRIVAVGDYTGDGKADIVWQAPWDGSLLTWTMNGSAYVASAVMPGSMTWQVRAPR